MYKLMKIRNLKNYGIPSYILNIWEKHYSPYLLPLQEDAVKNYGILNCDQNLLVIAPTSSGKSFIGEMAALSQVIQHKKIIYLVPLRSPAEEKYRHFKNLYNSYGLEMVISTRNHREEDCRIIRGSYKIAVMAYEKFNYFLLKYPEFLDDVSLVIIDEMQMINNPKWGPLLEDIILKKENGSSGYWRFIFPKENIDEEINNCLHILKENKLTKEDNKGILSLTPRGILIAAKRIKVETYLFLKTWINYSKKGEISNLEILYLLSQSPDGKELPIPFYHNCINDYKKERYNCQQEEVYAERILHLISEQNEEDKKLYQNNILLKKCKEDEVLSLEEHLSFKKILLLYDWMRGNKNVKTIEQEYNLYRGAIYRLGEGFSWLADSLAAIAENTGWKKKRKEDLNQIKLLSNRLILSSFPSKNYKPETRNPKPETRNLPPETRNPKPVTILEIDIHRPDRIIFMGEKIEVTATEFSLIHLLAQHPEQVMSYNELLYELWEDEEDAIYNRVSFHISKIRRTILKIIGESKTTKEKVTDIFVVVPGRGVMLNINDKELKIN